MLDAKKNRLDYGHQLKPPYGYELDFAVTTTYTLDLEAILLIPVALFFSEDLDFDPKGIRDDMLEALTNASKHIAVYHQKGKIKKPNTYNFLISYWEKGTHPIQMPKYCQSFHPKVWVVRYKSEDKKKPVKYRFINTSRNLTFSRDWDMAISTDGEVNTSISGQNQGIIDLLQYLNKEHPAVPKEFFKELPMVQFEVPDNFESIHFHPIGIPKGKSKEKYMNPVLTKEVVQDSRLIMSPFVQDTAIKKLCKFSKQTILLSTEYDLQGLNRETTLSQVQSTYMFSPFIEDAEHREDLSEPEYEAMNQSLHAKFYIDKKGRESSWYLGSANASAPSKVRNVEFLVELKTSKYSLSPVAMEKKFSLKEGETGISLFEPFNNSTREETKVERRREMDIRKLIHGLSDIYIHGQANLNKEGLHDLVIKIPKTDIIIPNEFKVKVKPLPEQRKEAMEVDFTVDTEITTFKAFEEIYLSPFLIFEIWEGKQAVKSFVLNMDIDLNDSRFSKIFSTIINNKSKFLSYLSFLLSEETPKPHNEEEEETEDVDNLTSKQLGEGNAIAYFKGTPVYEKLLIAASKTPNKLKKIDDLIKRLEGEMEKDGKKIISEDFENMWDIFRQYCNTKK
jgi:hypothetical protein